MYIILSQNSSRIIIPTFQFLTYPILKSIQLRNRERGRERVVFEKGNKKKGKKRKFINITIVKEIHREVGENSWNANELKTLSSFFGTLGELGPRRRESVFPGNAARLANFEPRLRGGQAKQKNLPGKLVRNKRERNIAIVLINICKYSRYFFGIELW